MNTNEQNEKMFYRTIQNNSFKTTSFSCWLPDHLEVKLTIELSRNRRMIAHDE